MFATLAVCAKKFSMKDHKCPVAMFDCMFAFLFSSQALINNVIFWNSKEKLFVINIKTLFSEQNNTKQ